MASIRPVIIAGHKAAARHKTNVTTKPNASSNHGTTKGVAIPPKKLKYRDIPESAAIRPDACYRRVFALGDPIQHDL
jgi:hypothetical protein